MGFFGLLTIVLTALKLMGYISISWWLVFTPVMIGTLLAVVGVILLVIVAAFGD